MISLTLDQEIREKCPQLSLGVIQCSLKVEQDQAAFNQHLHSVLERLEADLQLENISSHPIIQLSRQGYKALGKDPSRYRLSAEALQRRVAQGKGIYRINIVVDLLNLISLKYGFSIGGYNAAAIKGDVVLGVGKVGEPYEAIGRGSLNIENLPVLRDEISAFGSPTSDSARTMVSEATTEFLMVFFNFGTGQALQEAMEEANYLLSKYAHAQGIEIKRIQIDSK